ncbi:MAG: multicopper oxidase family protein [Candidatus Nanopelagicales bacterium]
MPHVRELTRRELLGGFVGLGVVAGLAACGQSPRGSVSPAAIASAEAARPTSGATRTLKLRAQPVEHDLGGRVVSTWGYGESVPGPMLRANVGDRVKIGFQNDLPEDTSVHWHGLAIRNDMDGMPGVTMPPIPQGQGFDYEFVLPDSGTHWLHPHTGLQLDRGLYAPFIVDDPSEPGRYDREWVVVLDDWTDGVGKTPDALLADLKAGGGSMGGGMGGDSGMGGGMGMSGGNSGTGSGMGMGGMDGGDIDYPMYLINGRAEADPDVLRAKPGQRVRLRIINAAADTIFNVALAGHSLNVIASDGYPVQPVSADSLQISMGERYDAIVTLNDGVFAFAAEPLGKSGQARALVRTGSGSTPAASLRPSELRQDPLTVGGLVVADGSALAAGRVDTEQGVRLAGSMSDYRWTINGRTYDQTEPLTIQQGQLGRFHISNHSMMPHPMHFHGHTFQVGDAGGRGPRKDTVLVPAMGSLAIDLRADNPGKWMVHCHNLYHAEAGMMTRLEYTA